MHSTSSAAAARGLLLLLLLVVGRLVERVLHGALEALLELGAELHGGDVDRLVRARVESRRVAEDEAHVGGERLGARVAAALVLALDRAEVHGLLDDLRVVRDAHADRVDGVREPGRVLVAQEVLEHAVAGAEARRALLGRLLGLLRRRGRRLLGRRLGRRRGSGLDRRLGGFRRLDRRLGLLRLGLLRRRRGRRLLGRLVLLARRLQLRRGRGRRRRLGRHLHRGRVVVDDQRLPALGLADRGRRRAQDRRAVRARLAARALGRPRGRLGGLVHAHVAEVDLLAAVRLVELGRVLGHGLP
mmetsp:Transcript_17658/g.50429  ORF Transcript_17658/g.50429 Transcript_17658/m.50429 type:complete len:301 (-) Transcript_17658:231-1133(-)